MPDTAMPAAVSSGTEAPLALWLADHAAAAGHTAFIAHGDGRMARLLRALPGLCAGRVELLAFPPWDVLPYDRVAPSAAIVGQRIATLIRLAEPAGLPRLLLTSAEAALQRVPPRNGWTAPVVLDGGMPVDPDALRHRVAELGYHSGEAVSEPGEAAFRGHVIDLFPADADAPVRLEVEDGRIASIHRFDPTTQRRVGDALPSIRLLPATEFPLDPASADEVMEGEDTPLVLPSGRLVPLFDALDGFGLVLDDTVRERWDDLHGAARDAHDASRRLHRAAADGLVLPRPDRLFLSPARAAERCRNAAVPAPAAVPEPPPRRIQDLLARAQGATGPVVVAAPTDPVKLAASLNKRGLPARAAADWPDATAGGVACLQLDLDTGVRTGGVLVLQAAHLVKQAGHTTSSALLDHDSAPRIGDVVVHEDHGAGRLTALKPHGEEERIALAFADGGELLVAPAELDRIWRYGTAGSLDRIGGDTWRTKRTEIEAEIAGIAITLAARTAERAARKAPAMNPDRAAYDRLARRFPYALSTDQHAAVEAVLHDLRQGRPMDRLICGDVGFGKTEVALRAAAAVALSGFQVAIVAPTTVLARQHLDTFTRRFDGSGLQVAGLMGAAGPENRAVRNGLGEGTIDIVVGTQAIASAGIRWKRLGLVVIDEEQRFGQAQKGELADPAAHLLVMTATPIPRTMQSALVGLREVSVIATPPRHRQPTRTFVVEYDPGIVREALRREHRRGGQSFVVCPRIADLAPMAERVRGLVPDLQVVLAHGRMKPEALEAAVLGFSEGQGDVLLATNIIEAGLDIPRANTIVVTGADRFGLAQLHQVRGRVGRGTRRGSAYLVTEPGRRLTSATRARLRTLEQLGSLHAGVSIAAADMDQRGAGELFGEAQAGHVSALGTDLYHHLLVRAVRGRREPVPPAPPELHTELCGRIPEAAVPEADLRLSLYRRLTRLERLADVDEFADELEDRFGPPEPAVDALLMLARLRCAGAAVGLARIDAGPRGAALTPYDGKAVNGLAKRLGGTVKDGRVLVATEGHDAVTRTTQLLGLLRN